MFYINGSKIVIRKMYQQSNKYELNLLCTYYGSLHIGHLYGHFVFSHAQQTFSMIIKRFQSFLRN